MQKAKRKNYCPKLWKAELFIGLVLFLIRKGLVLVQLKTMEYDYVGLIASIEMFLTLISLSSPRC